MRVRRGQLGLVLAVVAVGALVAWALVPAAVPVDVARVERGSLQLVIEEEGETRVRDRYVVSAPLPGRMLRVELEPGDPVQAGNTVVARLQPTDPALLDVRTRAELQARVQAARAAVGRARAEQQRVSADLEFARRDLKRYQELMAAGLASREQLEAMQRSVRTLEEALTSADFAIRTAEYELQAARAGLLQAEGRGPAPRAAVELRSPVDGVLLRRRQESETVVQPGQPIVEIGDLRRMEVVSDLLSTDAVKVEPGNRVRLEQWGGAAPLGGRVRRVEPSGFTKISALGVEEQRVNVIMDFDDPLAASKSLGDGYRVEVRIVIWERDAVLKVPTSSLFRVDGQWAVYRVEGERAVLRRVTAGQRGGLEAELLSGLEEGDTIVVYPSNDVLDGVKISRRN
jgi:HlyD family secretion protein